VPGSGGLRRDRGFALGSRRGAGSTKRHAAERRAMVREIVTSAESIVDEGDTMEALVEQLRAQHTTLCALTGNMWEGSSGLVLFTNKLDARLEEVAALTKRVRGPGSAGADQ